jgi:hypothetical protein
MHRNNVRCRRAAVLAFSRRPFVAFGWGDFPTGYFPLGARAQIVLCDCNRVYLVERSAVSKRGHYDVYAVTQTSRSMRPKCAPLCIPTISASG